MYLSSKLSGLCVQHPIVVKRVYTRFRQVDFMKIDGKVQIKIVRAATWLILVFLLTHEFNAQSCTEYHNQKEENESYNFDI